jgi:putative transposase
MAGSRRAWRGARRTGAKAVRQGHRQTLLQARAALEPVPLKIVTDQLRSYPAAKAEIPELANIKYVFVKAAARLKNRVENCHLPKRECERRTRWFSRPETHAEASLVLPPIRQHFALKRYLLRASLYRTTCCPLCRLEQIHRDRPKSVVRFLISHHACRRAAQSR